LNPPNPLLSQNVKYFTPQEQLDYEVTLNDYGQLMHKGKIVDNLGEQQYGYTLDPVILDYANIFIITLDEKMIITRKYFKEQYSPGWKNEFGTNEIIQHTSLAGGMPVLGAGYIYCEKGIIKNLFISSGHYGSAGYPEICNICYFLRNKKFYNEDISFILMYDLLLEEDQELIKKEMMSNPSPFGADKVAARRAAKDGWTTRQSKSSGKIYYYNTYTGKSQWEPLIPIKININAIERIFCKERGASEIKYLRAKYRIPNEFNKSIW
jgi:hypothetical protein